MTFQMCYEQQGDLTANFMLFLEGQADGQEWHR